MIKPPICIDLTPKDVEPATRLGSLADALLSSQSDRVLVNFGPNADRVRVASAFASWMNRNDRLIRTRAKAFVLVVPKFWIRLQWRLFLVLTTPVVRSSVHRTEAEALSWLQTT